MANTHLTDPAACRLPLDDLLRRARSGERIYSEGASSGTVHLELAPLDVSMKAIIARLQQWEQEHGQPLRMRLDLC